MLTYYRDAHIVATPFGPLTKTDTNMFGETIEGIVFKEGYNLQGTLDGLPHFEPLFEILR